MKCPKDGDVLKYMPMGDGDYCWICPSCSHKQFPVVDPKFDTLCDDIMKRYDKVLKNLA